MADPKSPVEEEVERVMGREMNQEIVSPFVPKDDWVAKDEEVMGTDWESVRKRAEENQKKLEENMRRRGQGKFTPDQSAAWDNVMDQRARNRAEHIARLSGRKVSSVVAELGGDKPR
jgi:hypothetical protein